RVRDRGAVTVDQAVEYTLQAAAGLEFAHERNVIHRDVKPANLLLDDKGAVKVLDLGLARLTVPDGPYDAAESLTQPGVASVLGTADYIAPEQAEDTSRADARSDVYSLGCTIWYLLAARPIFNGATSMQKILAHVTQPSPSLAQVRADVPAALDAIFQRMVAKEPSRRFQTMGEVRAALSVVSMQRPLALQGMSAAARLAAAPVPVSQPGAPHSTTDMAPFRPFPLPQSSGPAALGDSSGLGFGDSAGRSAVPLKSASAASAPAKPTTTSTSTSPIDLGAPTPTADAASSPWPDLSPDAPDTVHPIDVATALVPLTIPTATADPTPSSKPNVRRHAFVVAGVIGAVVAVSLVSYFVRPLIPKAAPPLTAFTLRQDAKAETSVAAPVETPAKSPAETPPDLPMRAAAPKIVSPAVKPSAATLGESWKEGDPKSALPGIVAAPADFPGLGRWNVFSRRPSTPMVTSAWRPDGGVVAVGDRSGVVRLLDGRTLEPLGLIPGSAGSINTVAWNAAGTLLAAASSDGFVRIWTSDGVLLKRLDGHKGPVRCVAFQPNGDLVASCGDDATVRLWDEKGVVVKEVAGDQALACVGWSPDGARFAVCGASGRIEVYSAAGVRALSLNGHEGGVNWLHWHPTKTWIASCGQDKSVRVWDLARPGETVKTLTDFAGAVFEVAWNPAGDVLAAIDAYSNAPTDGVHFWIVDRDAVEITDAFFGETISWSPDGRFVFGTTANNFDARLYESANRSTLFASLRSPGQVVQSCQWDRQSDVLMIGGSKGLLFGFGSNGLPQRAKNVDKSIRSLACGSEGRAATTHEDGVRFWNADWNQTAFVRPLPTSVFNAGAWSPNGRRFALGCLDQTVRLFDAEGAPLETMRGHTGDVRALAWRPDGSVLAAGSISKENSLFFWNPEGRLARTVQLNATVSHLAWNHDGSRLATAGDVCFILDRDGAVLKRIPVPRQSVVYSPDGKFLAYTDHRGFVTVGDESGIVLWRKSGHRAGTTNLAYSPDGKTIASVGRDGTVRFWNAAIGAIERVFVIFADGRWIEFGPAGSMLAAAPDMEQEFVAAIVKPGVPAEIVSLREFRSRAAAALGRVAP
ncbi:MAG: protein kinase domain-containing protein, partial [Planctomycetia bacterium]